MADNKSEDSARSAGKVWQCHFCLSSSSEHGCTQTPQLLEVEEHETRPLLVVTFCQNASLDHERVQ
eukprot:3710474-Amphidinium_carterae.1